MIKMGNPEWAYREMIRELDRRISNRRDTDLSSIEEIENRINESTHDNRFYYECGIVSADICNEIDMKGNCDQMNAVCGGLTMFEDFMGLEEG